MAEKIERIEVGSITLRLFINERGTLVAAYESSGDMTDFQVLGLLSMGSLMVKSSIADGHREGKHLDEDL